MPRKTKEQTGETKTIDNKQQRINIKSKRKRTLVRKAIEVSQMCSLDILIIIRDNETNKVYEYNSGNIETDLFTLLEATRTKQSGAY